MPLEKIEIEGYRGFAIKGNMNFALPTGEYGSGLTIITGSNNAGKSSIIECLRARNGYNPVSFTVGTRNSEKDKVSIKYYIDGEEESIISISAGSSETKKEVSNKNFETFVLPSRRAFDPFSVKIKEAEKNTYK